MSMIRTLPILSVLLLASTPAAAQNLVVGDASGPTSEPVRLTERDLAEFLAHEPSACALPDGDEARRVAEKLDRHVAEFLEGSPWKAFHNTLGISGYEAYFNHPDRLFYSLSLSLPFLSEPTAKAARRFLAGRLHDAPPWTADGFENRQGNPRESYQVPDDLRLPGRGRAQSAFGVYAFWLYVHASGDDEAARTHWPAVRTRMRELLETDYRFDVRRHDHSRDEAQQLNGDLAGLIGLWRLARINADEETERRTLARAVQVMELRVNLERVNPRILERTHSASRQLHNARLARYCDLVPEVGQALRTRTDDLGPQRLRAFREERPAWFLAFGERLIGGENYVSPPHFSHALFAGAALVEAAPAETLMSWVDVPWCRGDLYFIEKCALALRATAARRPE